MASFFNIEIILQLLNETAGDDPLAVSILHDDNRISLIYRVKQAFEENGMSTSKQDLLASVTGGMADYLQSYPAPAFYKQKLWDCFVAWHHRIAVRLEIDDGGLFEDEMPRPCVKDLGVELIKALHDENGKTTTTLGAELQVGSKTIQNELRALDPKLRTKGKRERPLRIAGQEMHPQIQYRDVTQAGNPHITERFFWMTERLHPIALQLNTQEAGTLLLALYRMNTEEDSALSREMAMDIWAQLSVPGRDRIEQVFAAQDRGFKEFIEDIRAELDDSRLITFHTEEQRRGIMSNRELVMEAFKGARTVYIRIKQGGVTKSIENARIVMADGAADLWYAIPSDKYPDRTSATVFRGDEVSVIR